MFKLWKMARKAGDSTVQYPFAPLHTNKDMRGKPEHDQVRCIACGACAVACPANAIRMETDLDAQTITWSINYGRCIFCGRCEEQCPMEAIKLSEEFELAVMSKDDLMEKSVYEVQCCSVCGEPFAPRKEVEYAVRLLSQIDDREAEEAAREAGICPKCKRRLDGKRAEDMAVAANAKKMLDSISSEDQKGGR